MDSLLRLAERWKSEAKLLRRHGCESAATTAELHAGQLRDALTEAELETLTLEEAAEESGYSYGHLSDLLREGVLRNAGRKGAPRIRRSDLPRKPGHGSSPGSRIELVERSLQAHQAEGSD